MNTNAVYIPQLKRELVPMKDFFSISIDEPTLLNIFLQNYPGQVARVPGIIITKITPESNFAVFNRDNDMTCRVFVFKRHREAIEATMSYTQYKNMQEWRACPEMSTKEYEYLLSLAEREITPHRAVRERIQSYIDPKLAMPGPGSVYLNQPIIDVDTAVSQYSVQQSNSMNGDGGFDFYSSPASIDRMDAFDVHTEYSTSSSTTVTSHHLYAQQSVDSWLNGVNDFNIQCDRDEDSRTIVGNQDGDSSKKRKGTSSINTFSSEDDSQSSVYDGHDDDYVPSTEKSTQSSMPKRPKGEVFPAPRASSGVTKAARKFAWRNKNKALEEVYRKTGQSRASNSKLCGETVFDIVPDPEVSANWDDKSGLQCGRCGTVQSQSDGSLRSFMRHLLTHKDDRDVYPCRGGYTKTGMFKPGCWSSFARSDSLRRHLRSYAGRNCHSEIRKMPTSEFIRMFPDQRELYAKP